MNLVSEHRTGKFYIDEQLLINDPDSVLGLLSNFLIVRAESNIVSRRIEYLAYSYLFAPVPQGSEGPLYTVTLHSDGSVQATI